MLRFGKFLDEMSVVPGSDFSVGGASVEQVAGEGKAGDVYGGGSVGFESGEARVRGSGRNEEVRV